MKTRYWLAAGAALLSTFAMAETIALRDMDLRTMSVGDGKIGYDTDVYGGKLIVGGQTYEKGLGVHADSCYEFMVEKGEVESFRAKVGLVNAYDFAREGSVKFVVYGDNRPVAETKVLRFGDPAVDLQADLRGKKKIAVVVDCADDRVHNDIAAWLEADFTISPGTVLKPVDPFARAGLLNTAWIRGTTDKDPLSYKPGETMEITLTLMDVRGEVPSGEYFLRWTRSDDFGGRETGTAPLTKDPFVFRTKLDRPGFVRLQARVVDAMGRTFMKRFLGDATTPEGKRAMNAFELARKEVFFDGGAGVEPEKLTTEPEPKDFDAFWKGQYARLDKVPMKADTIELPCANPQARLFAVRVDCAGLRPVTGYLSVPKDVESGKTYPARLETHGYSGDRCVHEAPTSARDNEIVLNINAHGLKLPAFGATEADTKALRWEIRSHDQTYGFDAKQNEDPETAYFNGMVLRVKRALQYLKTVKGWNGKDLLASGGSQGGLQTIWAAGCGEGVTRAESHITWCCDMAMNNIRTAQKASGDGWYVPWTESMGYYDAANFAKRIPRSCHTAIPRAGIGDYCCPPMGLAKLYNNIPGNKEIRWVQGSQHGYTPPEYEGRDFVRKAE